MACSARQFSRPCYKTSSFRCGCKYEDLWKFIKLFKLMFWAKPMQGGGYRIDLDGPISPFVTSTLRYSRQLAAFLPCAGYLTHPFSKEILFTLALRRCDPSFPTFLLGSRSLQEGYVCPDQDDFSGCSPSAIRFLSRCDGPSSAMQLCVSETVFPCAIYSTFNIRS